MRTSGPRSLSVWGHLNDDGVLLMMIHNSASIVRNGMWNALKNGHFAYYSTPALVRMADEIGLVTIGAWPYALYNNGTTMLAFARRGSRWGDQPAAVTALMQQELDEGITDPARVASLGRALTEGVASIRGYLDGHPAPGAGRRRLRGRLADGLPAVRSADVSTDDMAVIADASVPKHGLSMPVNRIPIVSPADLVAARPDRVLLFVPDLLPEVRAALPEIEANGGRWVVLDPMPREIEPLA